MDDFVRTVGERSLTKLYDQATTLISQGSGLKNVLRLKNVLVTMNLVLEPLSRENEDYVESLKRIREQLKDAEAKEATKAIVDSAPAIYAVLLDWFRHLNYVVDDNNLLFLSSNVYQERADQEASDAETSL